MNLRMTSDLGASERERRDRVQLRDQAIITLSLTLATAAFVLLLSIAEGRLPLI